MYGISLVTVSHTGLQTVVRISRVLVSYTGFITVYGISLVTVSHTGLQTV